MRILLTGATGQIGCELTGLLSGHDVFAPTRAACDLALPKSVREAVRAARPDIIINPAAYTAVDRADQEALLARAINTIAPAVLAEEARRLGIPLLHFSTDYVFSGQAAEPYTEEHPTSPINVYGSTKLEGEQAVQASGCTHLILRTSWVYSRHGRNFLLTIERLARERTRLTIVADQRGTPNWARELARAAAALAGKSREELAEHGGIYHLSSAGETTWHGFAEAIVASMRLPNPVEVVPIATRDYPTPALRPAYSVLCTAKLERAFGIVLPQWEAAFAECQRTHAPTDLAAARPSG
ncbi:MAG: dTDP-4-dehydrorhamnose reductase [Betaproteobacteria bacterium]|nr:dTDP-4-dehydrorhamnose reductase [Betaproteobacteria bacterium]